MKIVFRRVIFLLFCLHCFCSMLQAQNRKIDSLFSLIKTDKEDLTKADHLNALSDQFRLIGNYDTSLLFGKQAVSIANKMDQADNETQKSLSYSYNVNGLTHCEQGNYTEALKNHFASLKIRQRLKDKIGMAGSYNNIGLAFFYQGNYPEALKNYLIALKLNEETGNKKWIGTCYNNIGNVYDSQGNFAEALKNHEAALKVHKAFGEKGGEAGSYANIGNIYYQQRNHAEALKNYEMALSVFEGIGNKAGIADCYTNMGSVFYDQNNIQEALKNYRAALEIKEKIGDQPGIILASDNIGSVYTLLATRENTMAGKQAKYKEARVFLDKAKNLAKEIGHKEFLLSVYRDLAILDSTSGNFKGSLENHKLYILYRDSLNNEETNRRSIELHMTYDFEKREAVAKAEHKKELESQGRIADEKSRKQNVIMFSVVCCLLLVGVFAAFVFRSLRITRKQKSMIEAQKLEVEKQKSIVDEKQKEILDSIRYARRIQRALITSEKYIGRKWNSLK
ncbi:MAG: tetratricopeptide repeat protein [Bacteroidia bacterium]|nr:tetratricopeptide repeat protein [Bacteroidia bacterium]